MRSRASRCAEAANTGGQAAGEQPKTASLWLAGAVALAIALGAVLAGASAAGGSGAPIGAVLAKLAQP